jgi:hypothetical protein
MLEAGSTSPKSSYALSTDFLIQSVRGSGRNVLQTYVFLGRVSYTPLTGAEGQYIYRARPASANRVQQVA